MKKKDTVLICVGFATINDIKLEAMLTDDQIEELQEHIEYKIEDISNKILRLKPNIPNDSNDAKMCVIYGVLSYLQENGQIEPKQIDFKSFSDGKFSLTLNKENTIDSYHAKYKYLLNKIQGIKFSTLNWTWEEYLAKDKDIDEYLNDE